MRTRRSALIELAAATCGLLVGRPGFGAPPDAEPGPVLTGVDVLAEEEFARLAGRRVGLITNQTGRDSRGRRTIDLLQRARRVKLAAIFSPEHGLQGNREGKIASGVDAATGLPVHSLYGATRRPTDEMLAGLDALAIDLQDVGVRFFTYATTMGYALEAAAPRGLKVFVFDRPDPIGPAGVRGPVMDPSLESFTGYFPLPVQHGMTLGELAELFNAENHIGASLEVVRMRGYRRAMWFDQTGLDWIDPSPNLRNLTETILYPGVGLIEGSNVSVGRGTPTPFELVGSPWAQSDALTAALGGRAIPGVRFEPADFMPDQDAYAAKLCHGVRVILRDRTALDAPRLGVELALALHRLYPGRYHLPGLLGNIGSGETVAAIGSGEGVEAIQALWLARIRAFEKIRSRHLLYD